MLTPHEWLRDSASVGFCRIPTGDALPLLKANANCSAAGSKHGLWMLDSSEVRGEFRPGSDSLLAAATACLRRCEACELCQYISVSALWRNCSWHNQCPTPQTSSEYDRGTHSSPAAFLFGRARRGERPATAKELRADDQPLSWDVPNGMKADSIELLKPSRCPKEGTTSPPLMELSKWTGSSPVKYTLGSTARNTRDLLDLNVGAARRALQLAACCRGSAILPRISVSDPEQVTVHGVVTMETLLRSRKKTCFDFSRFPILAGNGSSTSTRPVAACATPLHGDAHFFSSASLDRAIAEACDMHTPFPEQHMKREPGEAIRLRSASLAFAQYLQVFDIRSCPAGFVEREASRTLVAYLARGTQDRVTALRTGRAHGLDDLSAAASAPQAPPLAFFLGAWAASGLPSLRVVVSAEEAGDDSPSLAQLRLMQPFVSPPRTLHIVVHSPGADLGVLTCAHHLALAHPAPLSDLLLANSHLRSVYLPGDDVLDPSTWPPLCETAVQLPVAPYSAAVTRTAAAWATATSQRLEVSTRLHNETIQFACRSSPFCPRPNRACGTAHRSKHMPLTDRMDGLTPTSVGRTFPAPSTTSTMGPGAFDQSDNSAFNAVAVPAAVPAPVRAPSPAPDPVHEELIASATAFPSAASATPPSVATSLPPSSRPVLPRSPPSVGNPTSASEGGGSMASNNTHHEHGNAREHHHGAKKTNQSAHAHTQQHRGTKYTVSRGPSTRPTIVKG